MIWRAIAWLTATLLMAGCAPLGEGTKTSSRNYLLQPAEVLTAQALLDQPPPTLGISKVLLPGYLDRPQIVHRGEGNRLLRGAFDVWAEPLDEGIGRVLGENMGRALPARNVIYSPWRTEWAPDLRLRLRVLRFDGKMAGEAVLKVNFVVQGRDGKVLSQGSRTVSTPVQGDDYPALVKAMNQALNNFSLLLSREIAEQTKSFPLNGNR